MGSFTGVKSTTAPVFQELLNFAVGSGETRCYDATQTLYVAGNGSTFSVANGGSVTLVAGVKISMLPGMTVSPGGYMHAYISTNGTYCGSTLNPLVTNPVNSDETMSISPLAKEQNVRIYPNPTSGRFTIELTGRGITFPVEIEIFSLDGQRVESGVITGQTKQEFTLDGKMPGLYIIHFRANGSSGIAKIVKY
jgi:hypothetical protein